MANKPNGNLTGIKSAMLDRLKSLYDFKQGLDEFASFELLSELCACSGEINREISVYISRDGSIVDVSVGDSAKVSMPSMRLVRNEDRLCGVRCIHTHPSGDGRLSGVDLGTLRSMKLDCMAAVGVSDGKPTQLYAAYLGDFDEDTGSRAALVYGPMRPYKLPQKALIAEIFNSDDRFRSTTKEVEAVEQERAVLVGMDNDEGYDTLEELNELAKTAGALVVGKVRVRRRTIDNATYVGSGKANELSLMGSELEADLFIFDDELSAIQLRTLEETLGARVIDRTTLILDIFAARATSREGKLQVELAQMRYRLPRLIGQGQVLSRLGGGIGTRGPGEKKLEIDRRRISSLKPNCPKLKNSADCGAKAERRTAFRLLRLLGTQMPANPQCSTLSPIQTCLRKINSLQPWIPLCAKSHFPAARKLCFPTRSGSSTNFRTTLLRRLNQHWKKFQTPI